VESVTVRELRNNGGRILARVAAGERVVVTRDGVAVAELVPVRRPPLDAPTLLDRWRYLPVLDADRFRRDVDAVLDADL
jgi:prevent-host-death family protein